MGIFKLLQKYGRIINTYVDQLEPDLSTVWNADEMKVGCGGKWLWLWNGVDKNTRYLLATHVSESRETSDARMAFTKAKKMAKEKPEVVLTDGLHLYFEAFKKEFFTLRNPRTRHVAKAGIRGKPTTTLSKDCMAQLENETK